MKEFGYLFDLKLDFVFILLKIKGGNWFKLRFIAARHTYVKMAIILLYFIAHLMIVLGPLTKVGLKR